MYRKAEIDLLNWWMDSDKKPLILRGARQVGKSTLVRQFAKANELTLVEINLEKKQLTSVRKNQIDLTLIINEIQEYFNLELTKNTLLFFDEIQIQPELLPVLRYFYEEKKFLPIIAAGSLLEFVLNQPDFQMPVGRVEFYYLGPMTFEEFLIAKGKTHFLKNLKSSDGQLSKSQYESLNVFFKEYIFVGGMPEAVLKHTTTNNPNRVRAVHRSIIQTYQSDFPKYAKSSQFQNIRSIFERIPNFIGRKMKYSEFFGELRSRDIKACLELLFLAHVVLPCYHSNSSGIPLISQKDESIYKLYFLDVGLLNYLRGLSWEMAQQFDQSAILTKGEIAEQFAAQHLAYRRGGQEPPTLFYWLRDKKAMNAEVDFVIEKDEEIVPIEIKAGSTGRLQSLKQFIQEKKSKTAWHFDLAHHTPVIEKKSQETETLIFHYHLGWIEFANQKVRD